MKLEQLLQLRLSTKKRLAQLLMNKSELVLHVDKVERDLLFIVGSDEPLVLDGEDEDRDEVVVVAFPASHLINKWAFLPECHRFQNLVTK